MLKQQKILVTSYRVQVQNEKNSTEKKKNAKQANNQHKQHFQEEFGHCLDFETDICN